MARNPVRRERRKTCDARAKVTKKVYRELQRKAEAEGLTVSDIVRKAVKEHLEREEATA